MVDLVSSTVMRPASVAVLVLCIGNVLSLDNGLALTPPMGWLSWERYRCNTDCLNYPDDCISEKLYIRMAKLLVEEGYRDLGYQYVNIDDCWMAKERDKNGSLVPDPDRFPNGIKALADYMHSMGLKLGIYEDFGTKTCGGYPGSKFYLQQDAETFASWGVDMLKLDGCYTDIADMEYGYPIMEFFMNRTGRPMLYSCSWPAYVVFSKQTPDYKKIAQFCNIWRNYGDIDDNWDSVKSIIDFYGKDKGNFSEMARPGAFNDPDMIIVGNYGLSFDQQQTQLGMWSIMASPLFMSNDLSKINPQSKRLLQNKNMIRINQDPLGKQGKMLYKMGNLEFWMRHLSSKSGAFAVINLSAGGGPSKVQLGLENVGLTSHSGYNVTDVFGGKSLGHFKPGDKITAMVNPTGIFLGLAEYVH